MHTIEKLDAGAADARDLLMMAAAEDDEATVAEINVEIAGLVTLLEQLEFRRMFAGDMDANNAYLDIQAGSGGPRRRTGRRCCCVCTCAGASRRGFTPS